MDEFDIFQNKLLATHLIWEFAKSFEDYNSQRLHPEIILTLPVLPICLNTRSVAAIKDRRYREGSLIKVIDEQRDIFAGLQARMENMANLTLDSIYIASISNLVSLDVESFTLIPKRSKIPLFKGLTRDYQDMLTVARHLGSWFSNLNISEISLYFNISF